MQRRRKFIFEPHTKIFEDTSPGPVEWCDRRNCGHIEDGRHSVVIDRQPANPNCWILSRAGKVLPKKRNARQGVGILVKCLPSAARIS
jgi:hypothetical protein